MRIAADHIDGASNGVTNNPRRLRALISRFPMSFLSLVEPPLLARPEIDGQLRVTF